MAVRLVPSADGRIRRVGDRLEWLCPACEGVNPIDELTCRVCGNPILDLFRLPGPPVAARRPGVALGLSVVPGLGCWYAGSLGQGLARLLLAGTWLAVLVAVWHRPEAAMLLLVKVPFVLALLGLWVVSAVDARRLAEGGRPLVGQRALAVAAAVLSLVLAVGLVVTLGSSSGRLAQGRGSPGGGPSSGPVPGGAAPSSGRVPPGGPAGPGNGAR
ncbi:MAG TPA: hypothetical protein VF486_01120 [Actinomycetes bacterium]